MRGNMARPKHGMVPIPFGGVISGIILVKRGFRNEPHGDLTEPRMFIGAIDLPSRTRGRRTVDGHRWTSQARLAMVGEHRLGPCSRNGTQCQARLHWRPPPTMRRGWAAVRRTRGRRDAPRSQSHWDRVSRNEKRQSRSDCRNWRPGNPRLRSGFHAACRRHVTTRPSLKRSPGRS